MGGYDCCLFKKDEKLPSTPKDFWEECKRRMFKEYGGSQNEFDSIWHNEDSSFRIFWVDEDEELWGVLDW